MNSKVLDQHFNSYTRVDLCNDDDHDGNDNNEDEDDDLVQCNHPFQGFWMAYSITMMPST